MSPAGIGAGGALLARCGMYTWLADMLTFPTSELAAAHRSGALAADVARLASELPYPLGMDPRRFGPAEITDIDMQSEYIRLFDVGAGERPCHLYGGVHVDDRRQVMEELLRFYRHFGLRLDPAVSDLPDSIPTVLEFLQFLAHRAGASDGTDAEPLLGAQRDLLARHLTQWTPLMLQRLTALKPIPVYGATVELLHEFARADLEFLGRFAAGE